MGPYEVVISLIKKKLTPKTFHLLRKGNGLSGQPPILMAQSQVMTLNIDGANLMQRNLSISTSFKNSYDPMPFIPFLHHLTITQFRTRNEFVSPGSSSLVGPRINLQDTMPILKGLPICIHPIAHPYRQAPFPKALLRSVHQGRWQRGLQAIDHEGKHQTILFGKGNANPNLPLQRIALWRSEFFLTKLQRASSSTWETLNSFISKASTFSLCSAATFNQCLTVSSLTSKTYATPRRGIPLTKSLMAIRTFSSGDRRS